MSPKTYTISAFFYILGLFSLAIAQQPAPNPPSSPPNGSPDVLHRQIAPAVPFLRISPDARSSGMGDAGVAISPNVNDVYWNAGKLPFIEEKVGFSVSHMPWRNDLTNETSLSCLSAHYSISPLKSVGFSLQYFNMGSYELTGQQGFYIQELKPRELALSFSYAQKLSERLGIGITSRFIHSGLVTDPLQSLQMEYNEASGFAFDLAMYYQKIMQVNQKDWVVAWGVNISNIGPKLNYTHTGEKEFLPANLKAGSSISADLGAGNRISLALDLNKLLVPTPPLRDNQGNVITGIDPAKRTVLQGIVGSFSDAPGRLDEELQEVMLSMGVEYIYNRLFMARAGYNTEHLNKGNRRYFTTGVGVRHEIFSLDFTYLFSHRRNNPLAETVRITLSFNFEDSKKKPNDSHTPGEPDYTFP